jgi:hypothetical protein
VNPESSSSEGSVALPTLATKAPKMTLAGRTLQIAANGNVHVDLISMTGSVLKSFDNHANGVLNVSLKAVPNGLYVVRVKNAGMTSLKKIKLD